ncbi:Transmembrane domain-containing protein [Spironucleus salmonicida]|uniref:Transmembrane domain-containing protein n=1 Tax=Spironucleus salmonicida TaxID=348837 RepID=V6LF65_9EUKA|nr:Transmembrane domain-containing protein [Spironucleus salmonicida]|eukprot:EST42923.1 Transmembrane domain-containing protein [Spironucleus salmonicida]
MSNSIEINLLCVITAHLLYLLPKNQYFTINFIFSQISLLNHHFIITIIYYQQYYQNSFFHFVLSQILIQLSFSYTPKNRNFEVLVLPFHSLYIIFYNSINTNQRNILKNTFPSIPLWNSLFFLTIKFQKNFSRRRHEVKNCKQIMTKADIKNHKLARYISSIIFI